MSHSWPLGTHIIETCESGLRIGYYERSWFGEESVEAVALRLCLSPTPDSEGGGSWLKRQTPIHSVSPVSHNIRSTNASHSSISLIPDPIWSCASEWRG